MTEQREQEALGRPFEVVSRGDFVPGLLWPGRGAAPRPGLLVVPPFGSAKDAPEVAAWCLALAAAGLSCAVVDLPLQGARASAKLSARLLAARNDPARDPALRAEYERQLASDLAAALAWLAERAGARPEALGLLAFEPDADAALAWSRSRAELRVRQRAHANADPAPVAAALREQLS